jgi:hypothetical protein
MKTPFKLKINSTREYPGLIIYLMKQSGGLFSLIKSRETIPLIIIIIIIIILTAGRHHEFNAEMVKANTAAADTASDSVP